MLPNCSLVIELQFGNTKYWSSSEFPLTLIKTKNDISVTPFKTKNGWLLLRTRRYILIFLMVLSLLDPMMNKDVFFNFPQKIREIKICRIPPFLNNNFHHTIFYPKSKSSRVLNKQTHKAFFIKLCYNFSRLIWKKFMEFFKKIYIKFHTLILLFEFFRFYFFWGLTLVELDLLSLW